MPAVVDLAAMRDAMADARRRPGEDQPARPGRARHRPLGAGRRVRHARRASRINAELRVRAQPGALRVPALGPGRVRELPRRAAGHRHRPPGQPRVPRARRLRRRRDRRSAYPDTLVGTDSHTTMINGLGVLGWGVGGIEAEAAMLGQPMSMLIPQVVGFKLARRAARGRDRDRPRAHRHRDAAQEGRRRQVRRVLRPGRLARCRSPTARRSATWRRSTARRARSSRSTPRRCATCAFTGRPQEQVDARRGVRQGAGPLARRARRGADVHRHARARPRRRSSRRSPARSARRTASPLTRRAGRRSARRSPSYVPEDGDAPTTTRSPRRSRRATRRRRSARRTARRPSRRRAGRRAARRDAERPRTTVAVDARRRHELELDHGPVVIAAITSCTNTSNPSVMLGAGLLARNAVARGPDDASRG